MPQDNKQKLEFEGFILRPVGKTPGPTNNRGQKTFYIVFGLFDSEGRQSVHTYDDGTETPVVILSYPIIEKHTLKLL